MSLERIKRGRITLEEAISCNMWTIAAIVEVLERKGLCTKQDFFDIITELRKKSPRASIPETAFPEPYLITESENKIIDDDTTDLLHRGLTER